MTLLSVVIPTFQRGHMVERQIEAYLRTLRQGAKEAKATFELIVVDDCSPDGTFEKLEKRFGCCDDVRILKMPMNSGPGLSRNTGFAAAHGDWIWFLDDDDSLSVEFLKGVYAQLANAPAKVEIVSHSLKHSYTGSPDAVRLELAKRIMLYREFQEVFRFIVRKDLLSRNNILFSPGLHEDIRFILEMLRFADGVHVIPSLVVLKEKTNGGITASMSKCRIDGYIQAYNESCSVLNGAEIGSIRMLKQFFVQTLGVILLLITREKIENKAVELLDHLQLSSQADDAWGCAVLELPEFGSNATNFEYATSVWQLGRNSSDKKVLRHELLRVFSSHLTCKDLQSSLFLGPDEIRACCKRFFVNGVRKGDVVLLKAQEGIDLPRIQEAKNKLIERINFGEAAECSGCPYIERMPSHASGIDYLSLENFSYCNMKCSYCSPKYYGGTEARYNASDIVAQLASRADGFAANCQVVWGGGEPTLSPRFDPINQKLVAIHNIGKIRVLSNSLRYSASLGTLLEDSRFHLVTSIDAGTDKTFKSLRGKNGLDDVLSNLKLYQANINDSKRLTVKYIVGASNFESNELQSYVEKIVSFSLLNSLFQISCDFTLAAPEDRLICALYELALRLFNAGARHVFFDDLVRDRVTITKTRANLVREHIRTHGLTEEHLWTPETDGALVLWGDGKQADWLMSSTQTGSLGRLIGAVRDGEEYCELFNKASKEYFEESKLRIFPAGVQSMYEILEKIEQAKLSEHIFQGVVL